MKKFLVIILLLNSIVLADVDCKFKQEKTVKGLKKPLISSGDFHYDKVQGAIFKTTSPQKQVTIYKASEYKDINNIIQSIEEKNYKPLDKSYKYTIKNNTLTLKPKENCSLKKLVSSIKISSDGVKIKKIEISMKNGAKTTQWFY